MSTNSKKARRGQPRKGKKVEDIRVSKATSLELAPSTSQPAIVVEVPLSEQVLYGACVSYVDRAMSKGLVARSSIPGTAYYASVYMWDILQAYVSGTIPHATSLPLWLQCLGQALAPKSVVVNQGKISYRFVLTAGVGWVSPPNTTIGPQVYGYEHLYYIADNGSNVDLFPRAAAPPAYTVSLGEAAWTSIMQVMADPNDPYSQNVPLRETFWKSNVSSFAMPCNPEGSGWTGSTQTGGGRIFQANLEVPVFNPLLAVFANFLTDAATNPLRYGNYVQAYAGDVIYCGSVFHTFSRGDVRILNNQKIPRLHFVDFLEFGDVIAQWVSAVQREAVNSSLNGVITATASIQCPITLQEMLILLKNEMMYLFGVSQTAVQAIYPRMPTNINESEFIAFPTSSNTISLGSVGMRLPFIVIENMRSMIARWVTNKNKNLRHYLPVLGQYWNERLNPDDYVFIRDPDTIPSFSVDPPTIRRRRTSKGADEWVPTVEATIDLIDGASGANYYMINDINRLTKLATLWNEWTEIMTTYSVRLETVSKDLGVNVACSLATTRHWIPNSPSLGRDERDVRIVRQRQLSSTIYAGRQAIAISQAQRFYSAAFDAIQRKWILPINKAVVSVSPQAQTPFVREQIMTGETFSIALASEDTGVTVSELHAQYVSDLVKNALGTKNAMESFFEEQAALGHGGILSGLVAGFLGKAFGPTVGSVANAVAEIIPV